MKKIVRRVGQKVLICASGSLVLGLNVTKALALPPPEDTPEEVLRTEILTEARSPIDGKPLSAAQYASIEADLQGRQPARPQVSYKVRQLIFLLRLRHLIRQVVPFLDI